MNVIFRADSSFEIGTGHVMRCMALAERIKTTGHTVHFISRDLPGHIGSVIESRGFNVWLLPASQQDSFSAEQDAEETVRLLRGQRNPIDWLVIDHYQLGMEWERKVRDHSEALLVIDDYDNRPHICDLLVNPNYNRNGWHRYDSLVPDRCRKLLGPEFAILREEFKQMRGRLKRRDGTVSRILLFFGGTDPTNETTKALQAVELLRPYQLHFDVVVGQTNPNKERIQHMCEFLPRTSFHCQISNMAERMSQSDLFIGAAGSTTWERYCVGLPGIIVSTADNQVQAAKSVHALGVDFYVGDSRNVTSEELAQYVSLMRSNPGRLAQASDKALQLVDGEGAARIVASMLEKT